MFEREGERKRDREIEKESAKSYTTYFFEKIMSGRVSIEKDIFWQIFKFWCKKWG